MKTGTYNMGGSQGDKTNWSWMKPASCVLGSVYLHGEVSGIRLLGLWAALAVLISSLTPLAGCAMIISSHAFDPNTRIEAATVHSSDPEGVGGHSELPAGISRAEVIARYGPPDSTSFERNQRIDVYYLDDRPRDPPEVEQVQNNELVLLDAASLGTIDALLTPFAVYERLRVATGHTSKKVLLTYSADDKLKSALRSPMHADSASSIEAGLAEPRPKSTGKTLYAVVLLDGADGPWVSDGFGHIMHNITPGAFQDALVSALQESGLFKAVTTLGQENIKADYQLQGEMISLKLVANVPGCNDPNRVSIPRTQLAVKYVLTTPASSIKLWQQTLTTCSEQGAEATLQRNLTELVQKLTKVRL